MPKIVGAMLARNEGAPERYLRRVLTTNSPFCDATVVVDDGSTDETGDICREVGCVVVRRESDGFWGKDELDARRQLWELGAATAGVGNWLLFFDADMELVGTTPSELHKLCTAEHVNGWSWPLYDCWDHENLHRVDGYWIGWQTPRCWLCKVPSSPVSYDRPRKGIHVGHLPSMPLQVGIAPPGVAWKHLAYLRPEHREAKARQYLQLAS